MRTLSIHIYCGSRQENATHNLRIPLVYSWDSSGIQLGFLWYTVGIPVVLKDDLLYMCYSFSSYVCIFCAILNNLSCFVYVSFRCENDNRAPCAKQFNWKQIEGGLTGTFIQYPLSISLRCIWNIRKIISNGLCSFRKSKPFHADLSLGISCLPRLQRKSRFLTV